MLIPKTLLPITKLIPKEESRYAINAVLAERLSADQVRLVETDGQQMLVVDYPDQSADYPITDFDANAREGFKALLPGKFLEEAGKTVPKGNNLAINESPNGKVQVATAIGKFETSVLDVVFPNYAVCLPKPEREAVRIGVNAALLAKVLTAVAAMMGDTPKPYVTLIIESPERAIEISARNDELGAEIRAVVMPCRLP